MGQISVEICALTGSDLSENQHYLAFYNQGRPHSALDERTPDEAYYGIQALARAA